MQVSQLANLLDAWGANLIGRTIRGEFFLGLPDSPWALSLRISAVINFHLLSFFAFFHAPLLELTKVFLM